VVVGEIAGWRVCVSSRAELVSMMLLLLAMSDSSRRAFSLFFFPADQYCMQCTMQCTRSCDETAMDAYGVPIHLCDDVLDAR